MSGKHTPGPWRLFDFGFTPRGCRVPGARIVGPGGETVLEFDHTDAYCHGDTEPNDSDMALILAAPELADASKALDAFLSAAPLDDETAVRVSVDDLHERLRSVRAALAKAGVL